MGAFTKTFGNNVHSGALSNQIPAILKDGNTVAWYDSTDLSTITKNGSDIVSRWNDKLKSGNDFVAGSCGWSDVDGMTFNGVNQYLATLAIPSLVQPESIYLAIRQVSWTTQDRIFDGSAGASGSIYQAGVTPGLMINAGVETYTGVVGEYLNVGAFGLIRVQFNGASGKFRINLYTQKTGNFGALNMQRIYLGEFSFAMANYANMHIKEAIFRHAADNDVNSAIIYDYLEKKHFQTILIIGDSNSQYVTANPYPNILPINWVGKKNPIIINKAVSGSYVTNIDNNPTTHPWMAAQVSATSGIHIDRIIVMMGTNDSVGNVPGIGDSYLANLTQLKADHPNALIHCMSIMPYQSGDETIRNANNVLLQTIAEGLGCTWWDNTNWVNRATDYADIHHINQAGHNKFTAEILSRINV